MRTGRFGYPTTLQSANGWYEYTTYLAASGDTCIRVVDGDYNHADYNLGTNDDEVWEFVKKNESLSMRYPYQVVIVTEDGKEVLENCRTLRNAYKMAHKAVREYFCDGRCHDGDDTVIYIALRGVHEINEYCVNNRVRPAIVDTWYADNFSYIGR